jgi:hypothetical protein
MEQHVHAELARDGVGLVDAARADAAHVELLQAHNIRLARRDHVGDPRCGDSWPSIPMQRCTL